MALKANKDNSPPFNLLHSEMREGMSLSVKLGIKQIGVLFINKVERERDCQLGVAGQGRKFSKVRREYRNK